MKKLLLLLTLLTTFSFASFIDMENPTGEAGGYLYFPSLVNYSDIPPNYYIHFVKYGQTYFALKPNFWNTDLIAGDSSKIIGGYNASEDRYYLYFLSGFGDYLFYPRRYPDNPVVRINWGQLHADRCPNNEVRDPNDASSCVSAPECTADDIQIQAPGPGWIATNSDPGDSTSCSALVDGHQYIDSFYTTYPANCAHAEANLCFLKLGCDDGQTYNPTTKTCEDVTQCGANQIFNNVTHQCDCNSGYKRVYEQCVADCSQNAPQAQADISGWVRYVDTYNNVNECSARASQFPNNNFSFNDYSDTRGCQYKICDVDEQSDDPCITAVGFGSLTPPGFVFDSEVDTVSQCSLKVDGVTFSDFYTSRAFPDCATDTTLYCYLEPVHNDNNDSGDSNTSGSGDDSNSSGGSGDDSNTSGGSGDDSNSSGSGSGGSGSGLSNNLLKQINNTLHSFYSNSVSSDNYWKQKNAIRFNQRTSNDNANNNKLINAINKNKVDMSKTNDKLDKLIGDTTPLDVPDTSSLGDSLQDLNGSIASLDDNISDFTVDTDALTTSTLSAYDDFATKTQDAITSMLSNIDFGIVDIFNVSTVSFVDVPISFNLPVVSTPIEGSLINADFANSLDFSLGRLAVLIGALIFSLFYIIDRLFR